MSLLPRRSATAMLLVIAVACGARSGLYAPDLADTDASISPIREGGALDVSVDCGRPSYCVTNDLGYVYQCEQRVYQCGSLERCQQTTNGAACVNPCVNALGNDTSNGCDFYAVNIDTTPQATGACFAVWVVNQWDSGEPARLEVTRGGAALPIDQFARMPTGTGTNVKYAPYDAVAGLPKDRVAVLFLARDPEAENDRDPSAPRKLAACPTGVTPAYVGDPAVHGTGIGTAFRITSNVPVVAYQMLPFGAGRARVTSATLLLPSNVWGDNYVAVNAYPKPSNFTETRLGPTMAIIGKEDGTQVTILPTTAIKGGGGLGPSAARVPVTYSVDRGQYLQFTQDVELTGSAIESTKPVGLIGGATLMNVPISRRRADTAHQMIPPVRALANEYVAVRYRSRDKRTEESVPWRIVGVVNGTTLSYEGASPLNAPTKLNAGQVLETNGPGPFVIRSQDSDHPFYLASYMTGGEPYDGEGDAEFVNVVAPQQYTGRYTFFTDPTYPETNLVIVRKRDAETGEFPEVTLDCAGRLAQWGSISGSSTYQYTRIDLSSGNFVGQNGCDNGVHVIESRVTGANPARDGQIGVTVWGWGGPATYAPTDNEADPRFTRWVSYGYPAGVNLPELNKVKFLTK